VPSDAPGGQHCPERVQKQQMGRNVDSERKWWPSELLDESMPAGRASPTDWIIGRDDKPGTFIVAGWDGEEGSEDSDPGRQTVSADEVIGFAWSEDRGEIDILVKEDGTYEIMPGQPDLLEPDRPPRLTEIPPDATHFWEQYDTDTLGSSMAEFAENWAQNARDAGEELPARVTVAMYHWSDEIPHRLVVGEDGTPRFEPVEKTSIQ
jgi:hypothetical protein